MRQKCKSWSALNKQLNEALCDELKDRITYFYTRFREAHDSPCCAAIRLDGKELLRFKWIQSYEQENDISALIDSGPRLSYEEMEQQMKPKWDKDFTYGGSDFIEAALSFRNMSISDALNSENYIIRVLAIMDKRVGKRTLEAIRNAKEYENYPDWVKQFYDLRLSL